MNSRKLLPTLVKNINTLPSRFSAETLNQKLSTWMQKYEEFVGLSEVKAAQSRVLEAEKKFVKSQDERREAQRQISTIQQKLHELHAELDRIPRGDDKYLTLITQEHAVIKEERKLREEFQQFEKEERENFARLSHSVRDSHEKERAQAEKTKYWSIIGSVLGTMLGVIGTTINNRLRMRELRSLVEDTVNLNNHHSPIDTQALSKEISTAIGQQLTEVSPLGQGEKRLEELLSSLSNIFKAQNDAHLQRNNELEVALASSLSGSGDLSVDTQFVVGKGELKLMLGQQRDDLMRIILVSSVLVPICTWALCKFVNL